MNSHSNENSLLKNSKTDISEMEFFQSESCIRASTAPSRPLTDLEEFKLSKKFMAIEKAVVCSNQLIHVSYQKFDLESKQGQEICQNYLNYIESLCELYKVNTIPKDYRSTFSQAYKVLYKEGQLSYLTEILDSAQEGYPFLWVNGQKYSFSQEVLDSGVKLMADFFKLQRCLRDTYGKITQQPISMNLDDLLNDLKVFLLDLDTSWSKFQKIYVLELMNIEVQARSLITKAIEAEKCLTSVEIREKMRGKILINCQDYLSTRSNLCDIICQINQIANCYGKGRDDLDQSILCETQGILRRVSRDQSKAIRILGQKIRSSFSAIRTLLKKYDKNIQIVDPQLKNNKQLAECLFEYQKSWERGGEYFCDPEKKKHLLHFSGTIERIAEKYQQFKQMIEFSDADIFLIIPSILILKYLDKDDKNLCKYFYPSLNQIDTKTFRSYFELQKKFEEWKKNCSQHYLYHNILEKLLIGIELNEKQKVCFEKHSETVHKILAKIKFLGNQLHRYNPTQWNSFMQICLAGIISL